MNMLLLGEGCIQRINVDWYAVYLYAEALFNHDVHQGAAVYENDGDGAALDAGGEGVFGEGCGGEEHAVLKLALAGASKLIYFYAAYVAAPTLALEGDREFGDANF